MARIYVVSALFLAATVVCSASHVMAQGGDVRTCTLSSAYQCLPNEGCDGTPIEDMGLPKFVKIDLNANTITSLDKDVNRTSKILSVQRQGGTTVMHGTEFRGWSAFLGDETGELTLSASGDGEGFVVFGACIKP